MSVHLVRHSVPLTGQPFPHVVVDGLWPPDLLWGCWQEFDWIQNGWFEIRAKAPDGTLCELKQSIAFDRLGPHGVDLPSLCRMRDELSAPAFVGAVGEIFGIPSLHFDPLGGGLHKSLPGGLLRPHVDFNVDDKGRWRRVNCLVYLNECNGGELRLLEPDGREAQVIAPRFNRTVLFACSDTSWHGHPDPLGEGPNRKSLAAYYFTEEMPEGADPRQRTTLFLGAKGDVR